MARQTTVNALLLPMMGKPSVRFDPPRCAVCGPALGCENPHPVRRGAGTASDAPRPALSHPAVRLGKACHGLAHQNRLHFRFVEASRERRSAVGTSYETGGHWEFALFGEPIKYQAALEEGAWKRMEGGER